jgi:drug/metabolite transporter (DMT)-like permease
MIYLVLAAVVWGSSFPAITYALGDISPMLLLVLRFAIAFFILSFRYRSWRQFKNTVLNTGVFLISIPNSLAFILQFKAQELTTASKTALFVNSSPVFIAVITPLFLKDRISPRQLIATLVAMAGVFITSTRLDFSGLSAVNAGDVLALGVGFSWALFIVFSRDIVKKYRPYELSHALCFWTTLMALPFLATEPARMSWSSIVPLLYLVVFTTILGYYLYLKGVQSVTPLATSLVILIEVVVAFVISHFMLSESFSPVETVGVVMVLTGVVLVVKR